MLEHTNERLIDIHITGPMDKKAEALAALNALGYVEKAVPWRDAFPSEMVENEGGVCLKATRERRGISQTELSNRTGIPQPHISEMERGETAYRKKDCCLAGGCAGRELQNFSLTFSFRE